MQWELVEGRTLVERTHVARTPNFAMHCLSRVRVVAAIDTSRTHFMERRTRLFGLCLFSWYVCVVDAS
jgi:hypothetical protein